MARRHPHRGHKLSAAARRKISARERGRHHVIRHRAAHHRGHKLTAAERHKISLRLRGRHRARRHLAHRRGHKMTAAERAKLSARMRGHKHPHRGVKGGHVHRSLRRRNSGLVRQPHPRRGRIYPSHFGGRRRHPRSTFNHHKRVRALRAPFVAGRRHVRAWK